MWERKNPAAHQMLVFDWIDSQFALYALSRARRIAPGAAVAIFPSHHCVEDDVAFMRHVELAFEGIRVRPDLLVLLGTTPDGPEVDYCWTELGDRISEYLRLFRMRGFWENPSHELAMRLWQSGCLWNSSVVVAQIPVLLSWMRRLYGDWPRRLTTSLQ